MATQPAGQTLQATALVHEAWSRLERGQKMQWESRKHFYAAAAQAMRQKGKVSKGYQFLV